MDLGSQFVAKMALFGKNGSFGTLNLSNCPIDKCVGKNFPLQNNKR